jgi:hypothetical protein
MRLAVIISTFTVPLAMVAELSNASHVSSNSQEPLMDLKEQKTHHLQKRAIRKSSKGLGMGLYALGAIVYGWFLRRKEKTMFNRQMEKYQKEQEKLKEPPKQ